MHTNGAYLDFFAPTRWCDWKRDRETQMRNLLTYSGRLFTASIEGTGPTLQDTMVAASLYLKLVEEAFADAGQLLECYFAWLRHNSPDPQQYSRGDADRSAQWIAAHDAADRVARAWLSDPANQAFRFKLRETADLT